jgi:hypothetical protein
MASEAAPEAGVGAIEVEFASGARIRICGAADSATVSAIIKALTRDVAR